MNITEEVKKMDVLFGRGGKTNRHFGNRLYRRLIRHNRKAYLEIRDPAKKNKMVKSIILAIEKRGGRFLQFSKAQNKWFPAPPKEAYRKTGQGLRERNQTDDGNVGDNVLPSSCPTRLGSRSYSQISSSADSGGLPVTINHKNGSETIQNLDVRHLPGWDIPRTSIAGSVIPEDLGPFRMVDAFDGDWNDTATNNSPVWNDSAFKQNNTTIEQQSTKAAAATTTTAEDNQRQRRPPYHNDLLTRLRSRRSKNRGAKDLKSGGVPRSLKPLAKSISRLPSSVWNINLNSTNHETQLSSASDSESRKGDVVQDVISLLRDKVQNVAQPPNMNYQISELDAERQAMKVSTDRGMFAQVQNKQMQGEGRTPNNIREFPLDITQRGNMLNTFLVKDPSYKRCHDAPTCEYLMRCMQNQHLRQQERTSFGGAQEGTTTDLREQELPLTGGHPINQGTLPLEAMQEQELHGVADQAPSPRYRQRQNDSLYNSTDAFDTTIPFCQKEFNQKIDHSPKDCKGDYNVVTLPTDLLPDLDSACDAFEPIEFLDVDVMEFGFKDNDEDPLQTALGGLEATGGFFFRPSCHLREHEEVLRVA